MTMRASGVALVGRMKILEGFSARDDRLNLDEVDLGSGAFVSAVEALVDLVLAIVWRIIKKEYQCARSFLRIDSKRNECNKTGALVISKDGYVVW